MCTFEAKTSTPHLAKPPAVGCKARENTMTIERNKMII
jgi:hypothetical protein